VRRGDIVVVSAPGDTGKLRPAVVVQSDWLTGADSVLVALMTSALVDAPLYRLLIEPDATNGLTAPSQVMIDKIVALPRAKCGRIVGRIGAASLIALNHMLSVMIGLAD
jgi:mRNA interferase MazF